MLMFALRIEPAKRNCWLFFKHDQRRDLESRFVSVRVRMKVKLVPLGYLFFRTRSAGKALVTRDCDSVCRGTMRRRSAFLD
jgi:hypothetical protein